jgi:acetyl-CoA acetyltransferase
VTLQRSIPPAIVAASQIAPGRFPTLDGLQLLEKVIERFLHDWPDLSPGMIDGLLAPPAFIAGAGGMNTYIHQRVAGRLGIQPRFAETLNAGATYGAMVSRAVMAIEAGVCSAVLCVGVGKFPSVHVDGAAISTLVGDPEFELCYGASIPAMYAMVAQRFMHQRGTTRDQLSAVAISAREWALANPDAYMHKRGRLTLEEIAASRPIATPLQRLHCSVPCEGGGAMLIVKGSSVDRASTPAAYIVGIGESHSHAPASEVVEPAATGLAECAQQAFKMSRLTPRQISIAQLYDAFAITPIMQLEEFGFVPPGAGGEFFASGASGPGGSLPVNTYGGLMSFGHTGDSSGMSLFVEGAQQVMGLAARRQIENVDSALVHTYGGILSDNVTVILRREP